MDDNLHHRRSVSVRSIAQRAGSDVHIHAVWTRPHNTVSSRHDPLTVNDRSAAQPAIGRNNDECLPGVRLDSCRGSAHDGGGISCRTDDRCEEHGDEQRKDVSCTSTLPRAVHVAFTHLSLSGSTLVLASWSVPL